MMESDKTEVICLEIAVFIFPAAGCCLDNLGFIGILPFGIISMAFLGRVEKKRGCVMGGGGGVSVLPI